MALHILQFNIYIHNLSNLTDSQFVIVYFKELSTASVVNVFLYFLTGCYWYVGKRLFMYCFGYLIEFSHMFYKFLVECFGISR